MQLTIIQTYPSPEFESFIESIENIGLPYYASESAREMEFGSLEELYDSVNRAMNICIAADIPIKGNFKRVYKSHDGTVIYDWKLSSLAYKLVCLNGNTNNSNVGRFMIQLITNNT